MPRSNATHLNPNELNLEPRADPLAPLAHLCQWLSGTVLHVVLGALLGLLAAYLMRRRHLHWSWAGGALGLIVLAREALAGAATTLAVGALVAAARGRRWHREDLQAGVDLAEIAAGRTTPLDALRSAVPLVRQWLASGRIVAGRIVGGRIVGGRIVGGRIVGGRIVGGRIAGRRIADAAVELCARRSVRCWRGEELTLGSDRGGRPVAIELGGESGGTHTMVLGATGSGKTVTQTWIATRAIAHGMAAIVIDPKDDRALREQVRSAALRAGRRFIAWTPEGPSVYNPYARGGETEIADKALAAERFTEPHYQRQAQRYLGHAVRALRAAGREVSLAGLVAALDPARLELLARDLEPDHARAVHAYLDSLTPRQRSDLTGVRDRLAIVCESDVGRWLEPAGSAAASFDLLESVRAGAVVCLSLQADSRPLLAQMLGAAIVQDLQTVVSALQGAPAPCLVVIDEFSAVAAEHVARLFGRARSAGMSLLLGTQELSDLRLPGREMLLEQVLGNLTSLIAHRQVVPDSAELIARLTGSRGAWRTTWNSGGMSTRTRVREHTLSPEEVLSLPRGCAAVIRLGGRRGVAIARMHSPEREF